MRSLTLLVLCSFELSSPLDLVWNVASLDRKGFKQPQKSTCELITQKATFVQEAEWKLDELCWYLLLKSWRRINRFCIDKVSHSKSDVESVNWKWLIFLLLLFLSAITREKTGKIPGKNLCLRAKSHEIDQSIQVVEKLQNIYRLLKSEKICRFYTLT